MKIFVTEEHIEKGIRSACSRCPVALAVAEHVRDGIFVHVNRRIALRNEEDNKFLWESNMIPGHIVTFIGNFDHGRRRVGETEFDINIPQEYLR